jgi:hypothetical protein
MNGVASTTFNGNAEKSDRKKSYLYFSKTLTPKQINQYSYITIAIVIILFILAHIIIPRFSQLEEYHNYADKRGLFGIPFFLNVFSNVPFLLIGLHGLHGLIFLWTEKGIDKVEGRLYASFFIFVFIGGFGSGFYHLNPTNFTLLFDRLPLAAAGMSLLSANVAERVSKTLGRNICFPLILFSTLATAYWGYTESKGIGDIRAYAFANFLPAFFIPFIYAFFPNPNISTKYFWRLVIFYAIARIAEGLDKQIFSLTFYWISGHTIKHLSLGLGVYQIYFYLKNRQSQLFSNNKDVPLMDASDIVV